VNPLALFVALFALTLALLAAVVATGLRARRRAHFALVALSLLALGATIWAAERLGHSYDLASAGRIMPIHLALAKTAAASFALPLVSGLATLRRPSLRRWHARAAWLALALTVSAAVTGTLMVAWAQPR
jgi:hypothetical protein